MVKYVTTLEDFKKELADAGDKLVVVDFTATWCGPCRMIAPVFDELATDNPNVVFLKVDVDEASEISEERKISAMPTFQFFKKGEMIEEFKGANVVKLKECVEKHK